MAAIWAQAVENDDDTVTLLFAGIVVSKLEAEDLVPGGGVMITADRLATSLGGPSEAPDGERLNVAPPFEFELEHAGKSVCLKRLYEHEVNPLETQRFYTQSYLVPHDAGASVCVVQFSTPNVEEASLLDPLFEAIAEPSRSWPKRPDRLWQLAR